MINISKSLNDLERDYLLQKNSLSQSPLANRDLEMNWLQDLLYPGTISRNFHRLKPAASQYYKIGSFDFGDEYEIEMSWATTDDTNQVLLGDSHVNTYYLNISNSIAWWSGGTAYVFDAGGVNIQDGRLHTLSVISTASSIRMKLNGSELTRVNTAAWSPYQGVVDDILVGSSNSNPTMFDGYIPYLKIWTGGDRDTGTLTDIQFDTDLTSPYILSKNIRHSEDVFHASRLVSQSAWSGSSSDMLVFTGDANGYVFAIDVKGVGTFEVSYTLSGSSSDLRIFIGGNWRTVDGSEGNHTYIIQSGNGSDYFRFYSAGSQAFSITDISIRRVESGVVAEATNLDMSSATTFEYDSDNGCWLGPDLITQSVWENPAIVGDQWSFVDNKWLLDGDGDLNVLALLLSGDQPESMRVSGIIESITGAGLRASSTSLPKTLLDTVGEYSFLITKEEASSQLYKRAYGPVTATITKPELREILEVAQ